MQEVTFLGTSEIRVQSPMLTDTSMFIYCYCFKVDSRGLILTFPSTIPSIHQDSYGVTLIIYAAFF
jgi:hypothetical protein